MALKLDAKILIIDDVSSMRKIIKNLLIKMGYTRITEASNGRPAWELLIDAYSNNEPYDFIISDWNMPEMNGLDLLKNIRADERMRKLPFLMITAEAEQANVVLAVKAGVNNLIVKPFAAATLKEKITKIFG